MVVRFLACALCAISALTLLPAEDSRRLLAQAATPAAVPSATLLPAARLTFGAPADSNSPAVWELVDGRPMVHLLTSVNGWPTRHVGRDVTVLDDRGPIAFAQPPEHGVWMEAVVRDHDGTWYGFYHNELPAFVCDDHSRNIPRIGAARSRDFGATWDDLGIILEAPEGWHTCDTRNRYFAGGVGDFSVILDRDDRYLYFFFSQYSDRSQVQGVAVARLPWAYRDTPQGRLSVWWHRSVWVPTRNLRDENGDLAGFMYPAGVPIYRAIDEWHRDDRVDAFWGPSVHWNTYLDQYVMLLNRAGDKDWTQEGVYVAFSPDLADPSTWSAPQRVIAGGGWYPQVIGIEPEEGTDKLAGRRARFYLNGVSNYLIQFSR
jgi:hypothetical protein